MGLTGCSWAESAVVEVEAASTAAVLTSGAYQAKSDEMGDACGEMSIRVREVCTGKIMVRWSCLLPPPSCILFISVHKQAKTYRVGCCRGRHHDVSGVAIVGTHVGAGNKETERPQQQEAGQREGLVLIVSARVVACVRRLFALLTATTNPTAVATAPTGSNNAANDSAMANSTANLPPTVPYRSAGGLASESPAAVLSAMNNASGGFHNTTGGGGGASVSTISPGSLAGNGHHSNGSSNNNHGGGGNAEVQFTARDAGALRPPDLSMGIGMTTPNPSAHGNTAAAARPNLSVDTSADDRPGGGGGIPPPSSSSAATSPTSRPSPRSAALRSNLNASRSTLNASLNSYYQTQNTHLESAFGAEELDVHQDNLDR